MPRVPARHHRLAHARISAYSAPSTHIGILAPSLDTLTSQLEEYNRTLTVDAARRFAESDARTQAADDRFKTRLAEISADIDTFEARGRANLIAIQERFTARLDEIERNLP